MHATLTRRSLGALWLAGAAASVARTAPANAASAEPTILNVTGSIGSGGQSGAKDYDRATLEAMPQHSFTTKTPWYSGPETFTGVLMRDMMRTVGASGTRLLVVALNDYTSEIPISDFTQYDVILAIRRDGAYMPTNDKGPLFIVYPYDSDPDLQTQKYYNRSAWQVAQFVVK